MFRSLAGALKAEGFGTAALFDLHPDQILACAEAAWERERLRRHLPCAGLADLRHALKGYGSVHTATGLLLDADAVTRAAHAALADLSGEPALAWAWLVEGSGLVAHMGALAHAELIGASARLTRDGSRRWLRICEQVFAGENLLTLRGALRPAPVITRETTYRAVFGAPVGAQGVLFNGVEMGFTALLSAWLAGDDAALAGLRGFQEAPRALSREAFAASALVSWFHLSLTLPDSPIAADLGLADRDEAGRLAGLAAAVGGGVGAKAGALLQAAALLDGLFRGASEGRAALAALWPGLEGQPDEDPETGAGGDLRLAFGGVLHLETGSPFAFGGGLQAGVLQVTDRDARVRTGPPTFAMTSARIAYGAEVMAQDVVLATGAFYANLAPVTGGAAQWTKLSNVAIPTNTLVGLVKPSDSSQTGPFAVWNKGGYIGLTPLWLVGASRGNGLILVAVKTLEAYLDLLAEANAAGLDLAINSGFRSYPEQKALHDAYLAGRGNLAAKPGWSNHESGEAIDIGMGMAKGNPSAQVSTWTPLYRWMVKNARRFGFMRTVESESWHWELHPDLAATHDTFGNWTALKNAGGA